ncbi:hypothetical protein PRIPAC_71001 [Pristionchus pacificus]|uniref:Aldo_ket_red domain-containing protein n=1 Tax=Pristionchus pacificus TaxID=54126 RepID=A0A2A6C1D7_PRIPA|nr:hypothetical protein PRIPAC_71001 [Pristionchus pacificus]|eukprot:PDM71985.1 hypothetical protein PRIPAC_38392 [Pristionchus pacificus]
MVPSIPSVALNSGARLPLFGLGTWTAMNADELKIALRVAIDAGYRLIDTAAFYQNEHVIGEILEEYFKAGKLKRSDVFITTKLPFNSMRPAEVEESIKKQLASLRVDYIDLYLIHVPCPMKMDVSDTNIQKAFQRKLTTAKFTFENDVDHIDTWSVMEKYYKSGQLKALGVSNFNAKQIQDLYDLAEVKPANLQVELHIYWPQHQLHELCKKLNMTVTAYAPIGSPGRLTFRPDDNWPIGSPMEDLVVVELGKKYAKTPAQILLRHLLQRDISVIPKSTNPDRVKQNINIFDFELSPTDQKKLLDVQKRVRLFEFRFAAGHRYYPFDDVDLSKKGDEADDGI